MRIGLLLPHFSDSCRWEDAIGFSERIQALGFDSVWVRDNLNYAGHGFDPQGRPFLDPFVTLSAVAGATRTLGLGTAVMVPYRHPLLAAQLVGSLSWISRGRFELGIGPGAPRGPFDAVGVPYTARIDLCRDTVRVLRLLSDGAVHDFRSDACEFESVAIQPSPPPALPVWYGGASSASVRRALEYGDGLLAGQCPFVRWDAACRALRRGAPEGTEPLCGSIPLLCIGETRHEARQKMTEHAGALLDYLRSRWRLDISSVEDAPGAVVVGGAEELGAAVAAFDEKGADLVVLDLRLVMGEFREMVEMIGSAVLPRFRRAGERASGVAS